MKKLTIILGIFASTYFTSCGWDYKPPCGSGAPQCMCNEDKFYEGPEYCKDSTHDHSNFVLK
jgi:hypothetical protein